ncbi:MAG: 30S ribosomal protein S20 [Thermoguttaceae bacterium]
MPNIESAKKRLRQNEKLREQNRAYRSAVRNRCKKVAKAVSEGNIDAAQQFYTDAVRILDRAGDKRIIHKNAAARKKSRLSAMILKLKRAQSAAS